MSTLLDFEKPILELEGKVKELRSLAAGSEIDISEEVVRLEGRASKLLSHTYAKLTAWQKTQVARHPDRPHCLDYVSALFSDFTPLAGDRGFGEDNAIIGGFARFRGEPIAVIGQEKGSDTKSRLKHNFGMAKPEGYRKAVRIMELADRFGVPLVTLVDTAGAYPGVEAEARVFTPREIELMGKMPVKVKADMSKFLLCPMPGLVVSLNVTEGQEVAAGDPLCVVEAMKMENVLKAERDGKVAKVLIKPGDSLSVDAVILEFA